MHGQVPTVVSHYAQPLGEGGSQFVGATSQHQGPGLHDVTANDSLFSDSPSNWNDVEVLWEYLFDKYRHTLLSIMRWNARVVRHGRHHTHECNST